MSVNGMKKPSETDWTRVEALTDETIDTSDIPPLTEAYFTRAELRLPKELVAVTVHVDPDVLAWFKAQGDEYEKRLNAALRIYVEAHRAYSG
jgi:uncharacterized protein (DUF4415 family)